MSSTYSTRLRLELQTAGENDSTWGAITNTNLGTLIEEAIAGVAAVSMTSDANYTLTTANGSTDEARRAVLSITSTVSLTATRNVTVPTVTKLYLVYNNTTGSQSLTIKTSAGTGITVPNGKKRLVYCDGTNVVDAETDLPAGTTLNNSVIYSAGGTDVAVADGGTGASTASGARTNLGLGTSAVIDTGTSGTKVALLDGTNTWSAEQLFGAGFYVKGGSSYRGISNASNTYASAGAILVWGGSGDAHTYLSALTGSNVIIRANGLAGASLQIANAALTWNGNAVLTTATGAQLGAANAFVNSDVTFTSAAPYWLWSESDGGSDAKNWLDNINAGVRYFSCQNDALGSFNVWLSVTRSSDSPTIIEFDNGDLRMEPSPTTLATNSAGFRGAPQNIQNGNYTFVLADAGKNVHAHSATCNYTIPPNSDVAFPIGTVIVVHSSGATISVLQGTGVTLVKSDGSAYTTGTRTVGNYSMASLLKADTNTWYITGVFT